MYFFLKKNIFGIPAVAQPTPPLHQLAGGPDLRPHAIDNLKDSRNDLQGLLVEFNSLASETLLHLVRMPADSLNFEYGGQVEGDYLIADCITTTGSGLWSVLEEPLHLFRLDLFPAAWLHGPADSLPESYWVLLR